MDGDSPTALGSLAQPLTTLSVEKFLPISNLNLPWCNLRPLRTLPGRWWPGGLHFGGVGVSRGCLFGAGAWLRSALLWQRWWYSITTWRSSSSPRSTTCSLRWAGPGAAGRKGKRPGLGSAGHAEDVFLSPFPGGPCACSSEAPGKLWFLSWGVSSGLSQPAAGQRKSAAL